MNFTVSHWLKMTMMVTTTVSLRNTTAERRGRQNACVRQTWQGYYLRVLWWPSLKLMFAGLLHKDLSKGGSSSAKTFFKQNYCHACHTRFAVFFPLPSRCVSSLMGSLSNYDDDHNDDLKKNNRFNDQNNSSARASRFLGHFFDVHCTLRRETS